jgi:hypothetical protein
VKYKILKGRSEHLEWMVSERLEDGWDLWGSPFPTGEKVRWGRVTGETEFAQAVTKDD